LAKHVAVHCDYKLIPVNLSEYVRTATVKIVVAYRAVRSDHLDRAETDRIANKNLKHSARRRKKTVAEHKKRGRN